MIDMDHNATTRLGPEAAMAMRECLDADAELGNPSSVHGLGRRARARLETARGTVARALGGDPQDLIFTSGGTEACALGVIGGATAQVALGAPARLVASRVEHPAVSGAVERLAGRGFEVVWVPVDREGVVDRAAWAAATAAGAALLIMQRANHELGTLHELEDLAAAAGARLFCDAVQAFGKVPLEVSTLGADLVAVSAHKIHGPRGAGALWVRPGVEVVPGGGGHQERGRRPGTEDVLAQVGFAAAAAQLGRLLAGAPALARARDRLQAGLVASGARVLGGGAERVAGTCAVAWSGLPADVLVAAFDLAGIAVSAGAACASGTARPSAVALAIGEPERAARELVRFSLGGAQVEADVDGVLAVLPALLAQVRVAYP
jgi:cysteine desulfurase